MTYRLPEETLGSYRALPSLSYCSQRAHKFKSLCRVTVWRAFWSSWRRFWVLCDLKRDAYVENHLGEVALRDCMMVHLKTRIL